MKIIVNLGTNYNGSIQRAEQIIDATRGFADGYVVPRFGRKYEDDKEQKKFTDINLSLEDFNRLMKFIGPKYLKIIEPMNHRDLDGIDVDGVKLLSEHFNNTPMHDATEKTKLPVFLDMSGLDEIRINEFLKPFEKRNVTFLHGNGRFTSAAKAKNLNLSHVLTLAELAYKFGIEFPQFGYVYRGTNAFIPISMSLMQLDYLEVFIDLNDGEGFETDYSFSAKEIEILRVAISYMLDAYTCGCFNVLEDTIYLEKNKRNVDTWLVNKKNE